MTSLVERTGAVDLLLREFPDLPEPTTVDIRQHMYGDVGVKLQVVDVDNVVAWSLKFDVPITFTEKSMFVNVAATVIVFEVEMSVWTHLSHSDAFHLLQRWGYELTPHGVSIPAAHAYAQNSTPAAVG